VLRFKGFSGYAGGLALSLIMIPLNLAHHRRSRPACAEWLSRGGARVGVSRWKTIVHIVDEDCVQGNHHPESARCGPRGRRNSAPSFYGFRERFWNHDLSQPIAALPLQIFTYAISPYDDWHRQAWAGAACARHGRFFALT